MTDPRWEIANAQGAAYANDVNQKAKAILDETAAELDELVLACMAAGVPASQIVIVYPFPVFIGQSFSVFAKLSFKPDYRCVRNEDIYQ